MLNIIEDSLAKSEDSLTYFKTGPFKSLGPPTLLAWRAYPNSMADLTNKRNSEICSIGTFLFCKFIEWK